MFGCESNWIPIENIINGLVWLFDFAVKNEADIDDGSEDRIAG